MSDCVTLLKDRNRVAKKNHICSECRRDIFAKETYRVEYYIFEGIFHTHKTCLHCQQVRNYLNDAGIDFYYGDLSEDLHYLQPFENYRERLYSVGIRQKWTNKKGKLWKVIK